jgi:uncharacterized protein YutE (UPF0331/DUF86 family)
MITGLDTPAPGTMGETFAILAKAGVIDENLAMHLKKAVGFQNIAVHNYEEINWAIVHSIATEYTSDFTEFARIVSSRLG